MCVREREIKRVYCGSEKGLIYIYTVGGEEKRKKKEILLLGVKFGKECKE